MSSCQFIRAKLARTLSTFRVAILDIIERGPYWRWALDRQNCGEVRTKSVYADVTIGKF